MLAHALPSIWSCSRWGLPSQPVTWLLVSSYLTISPLPGIKRDELHIMLLYSGTGRYVSVALSLRSPSLDVIQHPALWSSDFPRALQPAIACLTQTHPLRVPHERTQVQRIDVIGSNALQWRY